jgi:hypothetical protein
VAKLGRWVAKLGRWVAKIGRWVAKLVARLHTTAALWVPIQQKIQNGRQKKKSGQHTLARQKYKENIPKSMEEFFFIMSRQGCPVLWRHT